MLPVRQRRGRGLAQHVAGNAKSFVARMNAEAAAKLGMGCTRYSSPSGFYDAGNFAADLAELADADPRPAADRASRAPLLGGAAIPDQGWQALPYNNNPLLIYHYPA